MASLCSAGSDALVHRIYLCMPTYCMHNLEMHLQMVKGLKGLYHAFIHAALLCRMSCTTFAPSASSSSGASTRMLLSVPAATHDTEMNRIRCLGPLCFTGRFVSGAAAVAVYMYAAAVLVSYGFGDVGGHVESLDMVFLSLRYGSLGENDTSHTCLGLRNKSWDLCRTSQD